MRRILYIALALLLALGAAGAAMCEALPAWDDSPAKPTGGGPSAPGLTLPSSMEPETVVVAIDAIRFPDAAFRACVAGDLDADGDGMLSDAERGIATIDVSGRGISSLRGLEFFQELEYLYFADNAVTALDISGNAKLVEINGSRNALRRLDLTAGGLLRSVEFEDNRLRAVDVGACKKLERLDVSGNSLKGIDVSGCARLRCLDVTGNRLTALKLSDNGRLEELYCGGNRIARLNLTGNPRLMTLVAGGNGLARIDVSRCRRLTGMDLRDNALKSLVVSGKRLLGELYCDDNRLTTLEISGCAALSVLSCRNNRLKDLDASGCEGLTALACANNAIEAMDLTECERLRTLSCEDNQLSAIDLGGCAALETLECSRNRLRLLDIGANPALRVLRCAENRLKRLDVRANPALTALACWGNDIGFFDLATLPDGLRALAKVDALRVEGTGSTWWQAAEPVELSFPANITLMLGRDFVCGEEYVFRNLERVKTNTREDYPALTDADFANFRAVATTGMGQNVLYRSSSPINTILGRHWEASVATKAAGIRTILNLSDEAEDLARRKAYPGSYYSAQHVFTTCVNGCSATPGNLAKYVAALRYMIAHEGPYLVHCMFGRDRTGVLCALLECLMGASADEVVSDYMQTYYNFNGIVPGTAAYDYIVDERIREHLADAFGGVDILRGEANPAACAEALLLRGGMTPDEIWALKCRLM